MDPSDAPIDREQAAQANAARPRTGVLLVNLGTPSAPTPSAVRRYLAAFLSDRRVVDYPRAVWLPLLYGVVLNVRPAKTARAYRSIWRAETDESPLRYYTRRQAERLSEALRLSHVVDWAMRYGEPSIAARLAALRSAGAGRVVIIPLYPQYSATTNASVDDAVGAALRMLGSPPSVTIAPAFYDEPAYVDALAARARESIGASPWAPERIILSFHGLPERLVASGDPYLAHCRETAARLRAVMGWDEGFAPLAFQSRFGTEKWLEPSTVSEIKRAAAEGVKRLAVMTPGFVSDCIETLEEIDIAGRATFIENGGEDFAALPCLNDSDGMIKLLATIARRDHAHSAA